MSKKNSQNDALTSSLAKQSSRRYAGLIISIAVFLLIISGILLLSSYTSRQNQKNTEDITIFGLVGDSVQTITRDLFDLKTSYGEFVFTPHIQSTIEEMEKRRIFVDNALVNFVTGGEVELLDGSTVKLEAISDPELIKDLDKAKSYWRQYSAELDQYLKVALSFEDTETELNRAIVAAQGTSIKLYDSINEISQTIYESAKRIASRLERVQLLGIALALLYFLVFIFFFVRRLRRTDQEANAAKKETDSIMKTVNEGLFLVDKDLSIGNQYSAQLESLVNQKDIAGKQLGDVLENMVAPEDVETIREFIEQLFNEKVREKLIQDLNPLDRVEILVPEKDGIDYETRYLTFNFSRVYEGKRITSVLASVSDITRSVKLEQRLELEREQNDQQLAMLSNLLHADDEIMSSFIRHSREVTNNINDVLKRPESGERDLQQKAQDMFREIHALKGEASALKLDNFVSMTTAFEDKLTELQNKPRLRGNDFLALTVELEALIEDTNKADRVMSRLGSGKEVLIDTLTEESQATEPKSKAQLSDHFEQYVKDIANRHHKQVNFRAIGMEKLTANHVIADKVRDTITQLIRNAIVHGIETPDERSLKGKRPAGIIQIQVTEPAANVLQLTVDDDGKGLSIDNILSKAIEKGIISAQQGKSLSPGQVHQLIFHSGLSTAESVGEDAGRGVGMDVIKERVTQLKGKIGILSEPDKYTRFVIQFPN